MDMLWLLAKKYYEVGKSPSDLYYKRDRADKRSGKQIVRDILKGLGGE